MQAKTAKKILDDHYEGKITEASKRMLTEIAQAATAAGAKPTFTIKRIAIIEPETENYNEEQQKEEAEENTEE